MSTVTGSAGVRMLMPERSAGVSIDFFALVVWRMPLSHQSSGIRPTAVNFSTSAAPIGPSSTWWACAASLKMNGRPRAAISGTRPEAAPWLLAVRSSAPVRMLVSIETSLPSCSEPAMLMTTSPLVRSATILAKASAATVRGLPGAAPWPRVSVVAARARPGRKVSAEAATAKPAPWRKVRRLDRMVMAFHSF